MATCRVVLLANAEPTRVEVLIRPLNGGPTARRVVMLTARATDAEPELTASIEDEVLEPQEPAVVANLYGRRASGGFVGRTREQFLASMTDEDRREYLARLGAKRARYINLDGEALYLVQLDELWMLPSGLVLPEGSHIMVAPDELPQVNDDPVVVDFEAWDSSAESYAEFLNKGFA